MELARLGNKYLADTEPWKLIKTHPDRVKTILNVSLQLIANISILFEPFLPDTTKKLKVMLNLKPLGWNELGRTDLVTAGQNLQDPGLLFDKIEDEIIEAQLQKLINNRKMNETMASGLDPAKENVSFEDFGKMDIRVATILEAERVPKTRKLLKLSVDTGLDKRTVVSGIAEYFEPEKLAGQKVCILLNLEPREIKGIKSQGMILLSENADGSLYFVEPNKNALNGTVVN